MITPRSVSPERSLLTRSALTATARRSERLIHRPPSRPPCAGLPTSAHTVAVLDLVKRLEWPRDDLITRRKPLHQLYYQPAREPGLHGDEDGLAIAECVDPFFGLQRSCRNPLALGRVPHDDGSQRHGRDVFLPPRDDVGRHREARPDPRWRREYLYLDLEVDGVRGRRETLQVGVVLEDRRVTDLRDHTFELLARIRVDEQDGLLSGLYRWRVGLVHHQDGLDRGHVRDRHELRAGVVHRADHRHLSGLHAQRRDDTVDGSENGRLRKRIARGVETGTRLLDAVLAGLENRPRRLERRAGLLVVGFRGDLRLVVAAGAFELPLGLLQRGPGGVAVGQAGLERRARARLVGRRAVPVDLEKELPLLDRVSLMHREVDYLTHHERRQLDLVLGLDLAVGGHLGDDVLLRHFGGEDRHALALPALVGPPAHKDHDDGHDEQDDSLLILGHAHGVSTPFPWKFFMLTTIGWLKLPKAPPNRAILPKSSCVQACSTEPR